MMYDDDILDKHFIQLRIWALSLQLRWNNSVILTIMEPQA